MCGTECPNCKKQTRFSDGCRFYGYGDSGVCEWDVKPCVECPPQPVKKPGSPPKQTLLPTTPCVLSDRDQVRLLRSKLLELRTKLGLYEKRFGKLV